MRSLLDAIGRPLDYCAGNLLIAFEEGQRSFKYEVFENLALAEKLLRKTLGTEDSLAEIMLSEETNLSEAVYFGLSSAIGDLNTRSKDLLASGEVRQAGVLLFRRDCLSVLCALAHVRLGLPKSPVYGRKFVESAADLLAQFDTVS